MEQYSSLDGLHLKNCVLTIGAFDGIHIGHRKLLNTVVSASKDIMANSAVITFDPLPYVFLKNIAESYGLISSKEKSNILSSLGIDILITLAFNKQLAQLAPQEFIKTILEHIEFTKLIVGYDFTLGKNKAGTFSVLDTIGKENRFEVIAIPPLKVNGKIVSSSLIRETLHAGNIKQVNKYLGRIYSVEGTVTKGDGRGHKIGIPTANIEYDKKRLLPKRGVYVTLISVDNTIYPSVTNIGVRPTFYDSNIESPSIETHILNFNDNIYNKNIKIDFIEFVRDEKKFSDVTTLISQINKDIIFAQKVLNNVIKTPNIPS